MLMIGVLFQKMFFMIDIEMEGCYYYYMDEFIKIIVFVIEWLILFCMIDIVMSIQFYIIIRLILVRICMICVDYILQKVFFMIGIGVIVYYYFFMDYVIIRGIFFMWNCYVIDIVLLIFFFFIWRELKIFRVGRKKFIRLVL